MSKSKNPVRGKYDRKRVVFKPTGPVAEGARTRQEFRTECDINHIVAKVRKGIAPQFINESIPQFGDFSEVPTLAQAHEKISRAKEVFMQLPAQARAELANDFTRLPDAPADFFVRHGLTKKVKESVASPDAPTPGVEGGGRPPSKPSKKASRPATPDQDDQE